MRTRATARAVNTARERGLVIIDTAAATPGDGSTVDMIAEALRSFLRLQPQDPDRPEIEKRIGNLEEEQRLLDSEHRPTTPPVVPVVNPIVTAPVLTTTVPPPPDKSASRRKVVIAVVCSIAAVIVAGTAIGLGIGLSSSSTEPYTPAQIGPVPGTK